MKRVTKIDSVKMPKAKIRVAAYARVSTENEDQMLSLEAQKAHYEGWIKGNPEWDFAGLYFDEGITGTKKEKRPALMRMISDCEHGRIDFVVTKSISRFARNNADCLELTRKLLRLGIPIYFEKENIDTSKMESELLLSIMGSIAEAESTSISENTKWGIRHRFKEGTFKISSPPYGYRWDREKAIMTVDAEEAEIVRFVFEEAAAGKGVQHIANELRKRNVPTRKGKSWTSSTVGAVLKNEKYTGDVIFQKTYTDSSFVRHNNYGEVDRFYAKDHHEAIVSRKLFEAASIMLEVHRNEKNIAIESDRYLKRYPFSGKIVCGECGCIMHRKIRSHNKEVIQSCMTHIRDLSACPMNSVRNRDIELAFSRMMNKLIFSQTKLLRPFCLALESMESADITDGLRKLDERLEKLIDRKQTLKQLFIQGLIEPSVYIWESNEASAEADRIYAEKESLTYAGDHGKGHIRKARELLGYTEKADMLKGFDARAFESFVDKVVVRGPVDANRWKTRFAR